MNTNANQYKQRSLSSINSQIYAKKKKEDLNGVLFFTSPPSPQRPTSIEEPYSGINGPAVWAPLTQGPPSPRPTAREDFKGFGPCVGDEGLAFKIGSLSSQLSNPCARIPSSCVRVRQSHGSVNQSDSQILGWLSPSQRHPAADTVSGTVASIARYIKHFIICISYKLFFIFVMRFSSSDKIVYMNQN